MHFIATSVIWLAAVIRAVLFGFKKYWIDMIITKSQKILYKDHFRSIAFVL